MTTGTSTDNTDSLATTRRSRTCGSLRLADAGQTVRLGGWIHRRRDLGGIVFLDVRDRSGIVQVSLDATTAAAAESLGAESVVEVEGEVRARPEKDRNPEIATGDVEVRGSSVKVVGPAATPAIPVARSKNESLPAEEQRLRYRYLDLRRPELQRNLMLRHRLLQATRQYYSSRGFLEVETPILTKPTPEGARDYLVPSRVHPGEFYALPQSPQLYKQVLMVSGFDRYFQIARCFRDEDLRADRQPEFTQIDVEASFVGPEDIYRITEGLLQVLWAEQGYSVPSPFARMSYAEAVERYGTDRPDRRFGMELFDASAVWRETDFQVVRGILEKGGRVRGLRAPGGASLSRRELQELEALAKGAGAGGLMQIKATADALEGREAKFLPDGAAERLELREGDLCLLVAGPDRVSGPALDRVRQDVARRLELVPQSAHEFLWVTDFPLFARDPESGALVPEHHPFTSPHPHDLALLESAPERVRAVAYDVVYNGFELASGSIRIHDPALQGRVFSLLGINEETAQQRFGFLLEGLRGGAPPHGGIALGFDRIVMLLAGAGSLRDVIAFPKTTAARALYEGAPTAVAAEELNELHILVDEAAS
ncbi:MAG: aspartate--tRNA ligase [Gemmatimonadaceae bacterium]